jgi:arabinogalactan endo-1,4-beta-galactosidase
MTLLLLTALAAPLGVDANYAPDMQRAGDVWRGADTTSELYQRFARQGVTLARIRLWTSDEGPGGLHAATEAALLAQEAGLEPIFVWFFSDGWADLVKQPSPAAWLDLDDTARAQAIEAYAERSARHLVEHGVRLSLVQLGNEVDFGVAGVFEEEWPRRVSLEYMRLRHWPRVAPLLLAAQRGILRAAPEARFVVHCARWTEVEYDVAYWRHLQAAGLDIDVAGLSFYPTSVEGPAQSLGYLGDQVRTIRAATGLPVLIAEHAWPATDTFDGQFADWDHPAPGYALTPAGQRRWARDLATWDAPDVVGVIWWSPEWYTSGLWSAFALFDERGRPRPALRAWRGLEGR